MKLNNELMRETDGAKEKWWKGECNELEELDRGSRLDLIDRKVITLTSLGKVRNKN